jgi:hypothetical protein
VNLRTSSQYRATPARPHRRPMNRTKAASEASAIARSGSSMTVSKSLSRAASRIRERPRFASFAPHSAPVGPRARADVFRGAHPRGLRPHAVASMRHAVARADGSCSMVANRPPSRYPSPARSRRTAIASAARLRAHCEATSASGRLLVLPFPSGPTDARAKGVVAPPLVTAWRCTRYARARRHPSRRVSGRHPSSLLYPHRSLRSSHSTRRGHGRDDRPMQGSTARVQLRTRSTRRDRTPPLWR